MPEKKMGFSPCHGQNSNKHDFFPGLSGFSFFRLQPYALPKQLTFRQWCLR
jgi:hypothetical protein